MKFPNTFIRHLPRFGSDHSPILINMFPQQIKRKFYFMFENMWIDHPEFKSVVKKSWHQSSNAAGNVDFLPKLDITQNNIHNRQRKTFHCIPDRIKRIQQSLLHL